MTISRLFFGCAIFISCMAFSVSQGFAFDRSNFSMGTRIAFSGGNSQGDYNQYEIFGAIDLPWKTRFGNNWQLEPVLDLSLGVLDGNDETGAKLSTTLDMFLFSPSRTFSFSAGLGGGVMTEDEYGGDDFGGPIYFIFRAGAYYWFQKAYSVGYRYQHESNGSLYNKNPGLNMHVVEFRWHF